VPLPTGKKDAGRSSQFINTGLDEEEREKEACFWYG